MDEQPQHKFYQSYLDLANDDYEPDIPTETLEKLRDRGFAKYVQENADPETSVKLISYTMRRSLLKPQRLLIDENDYYVGVDLNTNTYYICYRNLMMLDIDRYKQDAGTDTLNDIKSKVAARPELAFRIYESRNGYHLFVLNRGFDYTSDEAIRLMWELGCDYHYIVYSHLRGWSVRLNKKAGEEDREKLYTWIADSVMGQWIPADNLSMDSDLTHTSEAMARLFETVPPEQMLTYLPDYRLMELTNLHIDLVDVFKDVGMCLMPAPNQNAVTPAEKNTA
jgi:hypothetical protein